MPQFIDAAVDHTAVLDGMRPHPAIEDLHHFRGALVRRVDRDKQSKSPVAKIVSTQLYRQVTSRNINTVRKLVELTGTDASAGP